MQTDRYGVNGTNVNELGQILPPMQVFGKYEPQGSYADTLSRHLNRARVCDLIDAFHYEHQVLPTKYFAPYPLSGLRACSFHAGAGTCVLDIYHDEGPERVE